MDNIYNSVIEALIFASDEPITPQEIVNAVRGIDGPDTEVSEDEIEIAVADLNKKYEEVGSAFTILRIAHGYSFATRPNNAKYVGFLSTEKSKRRLSNAALETLAIIAYKQPLTKPELEMIRGVNSDYTLNTLLEKSLVSISGRAETVGRPLLYATTEEFLKYFGLHSINDLPKPREIEEIMKDEDFLEQKRKIMMGGIEEEAELDLKTDDDVEEDDGIKPSFDNTDESDESILVEDNHDNTGIVMEISEDTDEDSLTQIDENTNHEANSDVEINEFQEINENKLVEDEVEVAETDEGGEENIIISDLSLLDELESEDVAIIENENSIESSQDENINDELSVEEDNIRSEESITAETESKEEDIISEENETDIENENKTE